MNSTPSSAGSGLTREQVEQVLEALVASGYAENWQHCLEHPDLVDRFMAAVMAQLQSPGPRITTAHGEPRAKALIRALAGSRTG